MTQKTRAELFNVEQTVIAKHLINIYKEIELDKDSTYSKIELVPKTIVFDNLYRKKYKIL